MTKLIQWVSVAMFSIVAFVTTEENFGTFYTDTFNQALSNAGKVA